MLVTEEKWYKILNELLIKEEVPLKELSGITFSSQQTTKKNIDLLNERMVGIAKIVKGLHGYRLDISHVIKFEEIMNGKLREESDFNSSKKRVAFIIKEFLEKNDYITIDELAERLMVSRTTVNNDLKELKDILKKYNLQLYSKTNCGLNLRGNELGIRLLLLYHVYDYFSYLFPLEENILEYLIELQKEFNLDRNNMRILTKAVSITIYRVSCGFAMNEEIRLYTNYEEKTGIINEFIQTLKDTYHCQLTKYDSDFLCFPINTRNTAYVNPQAMWEYEQSIYTVYKKMIKEIENKLIIEFDEEEFFQSVKYHLMFMINRIIFHVERVNLLSGEIQKKYPLAFKLAKISISVLEKELKVPISKSEIGYLAVYFHLALSKKKEHRSSIGIISSTGRGTSELIREQLREVFGEDIQIMVFSESTYKQADFSDCIAVFTTIPVALDLSIPIIKISDIFNHHNIIKKIDNVLDENNMTIEFKRLDENFPYQENVVSIIEQLTEERYLHETFLDLYQEREKKGSSVFDQGIAIPHAINKNSNKIIFCGGNYGQGRADQQAKMIFLLAVPETLDEEVNKTLMNLYDMIFLIATNHQLYKRMLEVNDKEDFVTLMKEVATLL